jgi:hypothetical protein
MVAPGEGEPCDMSGSGVNACALGLVCGADGNCTMPAGEGQVCELGGCGPGFHCGADMTCQESPALVCEIPE